MCPPEISWQVVVSFTSIIADVQKLDCYVSNNIEFPPIREVTQSVVGARTCWKVNRSSLGFFSSAPLQYPRP